MLKNYKVISAVCVCAPQKKILNHGDIVSRDFFNNVLTGVEDGYIDGDQVETFVIKQVCELVKGKFIEETTEAATLQIAA